MKPLEGILVVSVEQALAAPLCTARLAEAGARVIKIERAEGDFARGYDRAARGASSYFTWTNQGKESLALDFRQPEDAALLSRILERADVFVQNLAPGAMARAGFGSAALRARHPRLVTVDITGYGESEAVRHLKAYDFLIQAESGLTAISGGETEMGRIGVSICDIGAGMTCHAAVLEALMLRERTGQGAALAVSLFDVAADWMSVPLIHGEHGAGAPRRVGLRHPSMAPYGAFETAEGGLTLVSVQNEREWQRFCQEVLRSNAAGQDPRFASNNERVANRAALEAMISAVTKGLTREEFRARLAEAGIAFGGVNSVAELGRHPALRRREVATDGGERVAIPAPPIRWLDAEAGEPLAAAPAIGQHGAALRAEFA
ncbi:CaiB/BaiF CoA-transferase family protein [Paralimibaculum aggregatum]|uniref:CaiB/BaiF CoA-transferase family protein n=1 Tax=Paralimibaculum aggregatum TaxID=3036245 RepID=A0ABQ6LBR1_9RHOB|nr:CaiB/BaiF CoA-transferase family protein [Limibaculum sp. NKW23]GMG80836.1 CaiB/BaiF CoA-transferase family protein [Limibaculum sp. NKW23]